MISDAGRTSGFAIGPILLAIVLLGLITAYMAVGASNSTNITSMERSRTTANVVVSQANEIRQAYLSARQDLGYAQDKVMLQTDSCAGDEFCLLAPNTGLMAEPRLPANATTQDTTWFFQEKSDVSWDGLTTGNCDGSPACNFLMLRYIEKDVCLMINHLLHNKPFKEVSLTDSSDTWSNPMELASPANLFTDATSLVIQGSDYQYQTKGCVTGPGGEYVFFSFLDS